MTDFVSPPPAADANRPPGLSGRKVVFGMFAFALLVVGTMYAYWDLYTRPFRDLQVSLAERYPGSQPQVIGGKHKSHRAGAVNTLRIILRVDESPQVDETRSETRAREIVRLADGHQDLSAYEVIEVVLMHIVPEENGDNWKIAKTLAEWRAM